MFWEKWNALWREKASLQETLNRLGEKNYWGCKADLKNTWGFHEKELLYQSKCVSGEQGTWNSAPDVFISMRGEAGSIKDMNIDWWGSWRSGVTRASESKRSSPSSLTSISATAKRNHNSHLVNDFFTFLKKTRLYSLLNLRELSIASSHWSIAIISSCFWSIPPNLTSFLSSFLPSHSHSFSKYVSIPPECQTLREDE